MNKLFRCLLIFSVLLFGSASHAVASFDDGVAALQRNDYQKALEAWQGDAQAGDPRAQYSLGYLYQFGLAVPANLGTAQDWYQKAAASGNADALYALGLFAETGKTGPKDLALAMSYYRKAADTGEQPDAEYAVGRMILRGRGVPRDPKEGVTWLKKAANHNQPAAQYMLGAAYEAGWGVTPSPGEAYYWYRRSEEGDAVELQEQDVSFQPKIAIDSLRRHLSPEEIRNLETRLKKDRPSARPIAAKAKPTVAKAAAPVAAEPPKATPNTAPPANQAIPGDGREAAEDGLPGGALTRQP